MSNEAVTLDAQEAAFLAARLRRLFAHFQYELPEFAKGDADASLIRIAGSCIGAVLAKAPCDMGPICIGCTPRKEDGSCPGAPDAGVKGMDKCETCGGSRGGVPGNENRVDGKLMCDYCHGDLIRTHGVGVVEAPSSDPRDDDAYFNGKDGWRNA